MGIDSINWKDLNTGYNHSSKTDHLNNLKKKKTRITKKVNTNLPKKKKTKKYSP